MIEFQLNEVQEATREAFSQFASGRLSDSAQKWHVAGRVPGEVLDELWGLGLVQEASAAESEGALLSVVALEEIARGDASSAFRLAASAGYFRLLATAGSAHQNEKAKSLLAADKFANAAVLIYEEGMGRSVGDIRSHVTRTPSGFALNGSKLAVGVSDHSSHFAVYAHDDHGGHFWLVDSSKEGVHVSNLQGSLGLRGANLCVVRFNDVELNESDRVPGDAAAQQLQALNASRIATSAILTGVASAIKEYTIPYIKQRVVHGEELAKKQTIAFRIADMHIKIEAMRLMTWRSAWCFDNEKDVVKMARLSHAYSVRHAMWVADEALQMFGGHGYASEFPLEMWYRNVRTLGLLNGIVGI